MIAWLDRIGFWRWAPAAYVVVALLLGLVELWDAAITREADSLWFALAALLFGGGAGLIRFRPRS